MSEWLETQAEDRAADARDESARLRRRIEALEKMLNEARLQLEYVNEKQERGSTNRVLQQIRAALQPTP